tara:strand:+ start:382 stop:1326 length:945 start_codon:yes stop_codon:yes gene_type:complete
MDNGDSSLVSIIINCYNGEKYLKEAIKSIYSQTYQNWEIIFFDNNSTDKSAAIAKSFDKKLKYFKNKSTVSLGEARKLAMKCANGDWVGFLDSDDLWYPDKLKVQIQYLKKGNYSMCYAGIDEINSNGTLIRQKIPNYNSGSVFANQLKNFEVNMVTPLVKRSFLKKHSLEFDKRIMVSEEYNLFMKIMAISEVCIIKKSLGAWRISENTTTMKQISNWHKDRKLTLDDIVKKYPNINLKYSNEFNEAYNRGKYYQARYLMFSENFQDARKVMKSISSANFLYFLLYLLTYFPKSWNFIHTDKIKKNISKKIGF